MSPMGNGTPRAFAPIVAFALAVAPLALLSDSIVGPTVALAVLGAAGMGFGAAAFLRHGGRYITGAGIYCLAAGIFIGGVSMYFAIVLPPAATAFSSGTSRETLVTAVAVAYLTTVCVNFGWWGRTSSPLDPTLPRVRPQSIAAARNIGTLLIIVGLGLGATGRDVGSIPSAAMFDGAVLIGGSAILAGRTLIGRTWGVVVATLAFGVFVVTSFSGLGRLILVSLPLAVLIVAQSRRQLRRVKIIILVSVIPALAVFGYVGLNRIDAVNSSANTDDTGLASVFAPMLTFGQLIDEDVNRQAPDFLVTDAVVLVPRTLWPNKPLGAGRTMALKLRPRSALQSNLSLAALNQGEWYYDLGIPGLLIMVPLTSLAVRWIDRRLGRAKRRSLNTGALLSLVMFAVLAASLSDLVWAGSFTWVGRSSARVLVLMPFWLFAQATEGIRLASAKRRPVRRTELVANNDRRM